ncbi:uroporphyrinogen-III synthase [Tropicimonas sp. TH_r6]|uniref:uroporphyrinogen-III synthase n=1 Tax=Tropicimonas sp. TH_r6 TaxID=3082085 RepID=UPI00295574D3|nr:uroporphyrinogen-III synthase [Tropicimonas sp. TH_r6]MDV7141074.1 uroporphyrinogen-III synthase [Tropicimonas sp. TH_r6]
MNLRATSLLLTRPERAALRFQSECEARLGRFAHVVVSPLMKIVPLPFEDPPGSNDIPIFTSENGVAVLAERDFVPDHPVWCVGARTALRAQDAGFLVAGVEKDAENLVNRLLSSHPAGALVHVAGRHRRGDIVGRLCAAGHDARVVEVYDQAARPLSGPASRLLQSDETIVAPLFSPRSARLLAQEAGERRAVVHAICISEATRAAWSARDGEICLTAPSPDAEGILQTMVRLFDADTSA